MARPGTDPRTSAEFFKMCGAGNDFVVVDNRRKLFEGDLTEFVRRICSRRLSIGADGALFLEGSRRASFRIEYFNSDGGRAAFCANGTRCAARFAFLSVIAGSKMTIETDWGVVGAEVGGDEVTLSLPDVEEQPEPRCVTFEDGNLDGILLRVGVPHFVSLFPADLRKLDVEGLGRAVRRHEAFAPEGTNVHFLRPLSESEGEIRSYERGVEAETLSCGSGVVAAALAGIKGGFFRAPVRLRTRSGITLEVAGSVFERGFRDLRLRGDARVVFRSHFGAETAGGFPLPDDPAA